MTRDTNFFIFDLLLKMKIYLISAHRILHDKLYHGLIGLSIIINKMRTIRHYRQIQSVHFMHIAIDFIDENDDELKKP